MFQIKKPISYVKFGNQPIDSQHKKKTDGHQVPRKYMHFSGTNHSPEPRKKPSYFPLNPGCLIGILILVYYIALYNCLEPNWPVFLKVNPPKQGLFQSKEGSFGF